MRLIEMAARPVELVVDPFLGSGTTTLACLATRRHFLGCDVDPGAVSLAMERLTTVVYAEEMLSSDAAKGVS
jgi:DNA modification methylase